MTMTITEKAFKKKLAERLTIFQEHKPDFVTGCGAHGVIAAVYASTFLGVPYRQFGWNSPDKNLLVVAAACGTGKSLKKLTQQLIKKAAYVESIAVYEQAEKIDFWFETFN